MFIVASIFIVILVVICIGLFSSGDAAGDGQFEIDDDLTPNEQWFSPAPIARGEQVVVQILGTYQYSTNHDFETWYADGRYYWKSGSQPSSYRCYDSVFFDDHQSPAAPVREERHLHQYWFLYEGTGAHMAVFLQQPKNFSFYYQHPHSGLTITLSAPTAADESFIRAHAAEQARKLQKEQEAREREAAEALEAERHTRFRTIEARYGDALFSWRTDEQALARYAREYRAELLTRQSAIDTAYDAFHAEDLDFAEWLRGNHADLYHRVDAVFYYRVRAIAESLGAEEPRRPKLTPEERQAKFARYRDRALERDRIQAEDRMAAVRQKLNLLQQFRDDLDAYELDDDERDRLIKEFEDDLFAPTEENFDGTFKQV